MGSTGYISSARFAQHLTSPTHPERPDRIRAVATAVRAAGMIDSPDPFPDFRIALGAMESGLPKLVELPEPTPADEKWTRLVHTEAHIQKVKHVCAAGGGVVDLGDTPVCPESYDIALLGIGALLQCCDAVATGKLKRSFAAVRPPGHHAEPHRPMGFCLFSNIAIAAKYLQVQHGVGKIAIVDFDVHHGNGTQACLEADPSVLFVSLHQDPRTCYPGSGYASEIGIGLGAGFTLNIPLPPGTDDERYLAAFEAQVLPALDAYQPELLLISAGFDAHWQA
jgi:acetoin utilization deacetylase AcuC-like enzyme